MKSTTDTCLETAEAVQIAAFFPTASAAGRLRTDKGLYAALVDLEQQDEEAAAQLLSEAEQTFFQQLRHPKRRREWLGGRIAAKAALLNLPDADDFEARARHLTILPNAQGRPTVSGGASGLSLSITHSGRYAAALAAQGRSCGLDLQKVSEKLFALISCFAIEEELRLLADSVGRDAAALTMLWSVKEAVKKSLPHNQPNIFAGIKVARITPAGGRSWRFECAAQTVTAYDFSDYALALTCGGQMLHAAGFPRA